MTGLRRVDAATLPASPAPRADAATTATVSRVLDEVRREGGPAVRRWAEALGDLPPGGALVIGRAACRAALEELEPELRRTLERTAARIEAFARAHRAALAAVEVEVPGGRAGIEYAPVARAGCYAPGGRHPLPSSVLMTTLTARAAGVEEIWVASPRPAPVTLAAAWLGGARGVLAVGGAQAIGALAFGAREGPELEVPACEVIVGPGNRWVTEAKRQVAGEVRIDMLAGPSELLVLADASADPALIAADLLAQAEHDPDARPMLASTSAALLDAVDAALAAQLPDLPTREAAEAALTHGWAALVDDAPALARVANEVAPEHLALHLEAPRLVAARVESAGAIFFGGGSAEVFADYGVGPNHVLPTSGRARAHAGLSVLDFLRPRAWLEVEPADALIDDVARLARVEGLEAHARAAERRRR